MLLFIFAMVLTAILLIFIGILGHPQLTQRRVPLPVKEESPIRKKNFFSYIYMAFPFGQNLVEKLRLDKKLRDRLLAAHLNITSGQFFSIKLFFMILGGIVGSSFINPPQPWAILGAIAIAYVLPDIWLTQKVNKRRYELARVLPETVDLLGLCVEAGLDFTTSVKWVIEKKVTNNPMLEELGLVLEEIRWGKQRSLALKDMARRLDIAEVSSFVQALVQAERMGTPVSETFGIISEDTRLQRFRRGERIALTAPIKILFPLIFCILPVIAIIVGGPVMLQFMQGGLFTGFNQ
ncbi:MAG: type II secretion system F family protein [Candidatus Omnitrophota bacterium]